MKWRNRITGGFVVGPPHLGYPYELVDGPPADYGAHTNDELRRLLTSRGLPTTGVKAELVARLRDSDGS